MQQHIHNFNEFIVSQDMEKRCVGLFTGKIGLSIYFYQKGKSQRDGFFKEYQLDMSDSRIECEFAKHKQWREETKLRATPTILIEGYKIPENYGIEDIRYFTDFDFEIK
jgi:hypothetical protein